MGYHSNMDSNDGYTDNIPNNLSDGYPKSELPTIIQRDGRSQPSATEPRGRRSTSPSSKSLTEYPGNSRWPGPHASTPKTPSSLLLLLLVLLVVVLLVLLLRSPKLAVWIPEDIECRRWSEIKRWRVVEHQPRWRWPWTPRDHG